MNVSEYKREHDQCELAQLFPRHGREIIVPLKPSVRFPLFGGKCYVDASELHHVIGGDPMGRSNDPRNVLHLNHYVHEFVTQHACAGRILSCWSLRLQGRIDWAYLSNISRKAYPSIFDTDLYAAACQQFPWIDVMRCELISRRVA